MTVHTTLNRMQTRMRMKSLGVNLTLKYYEVRPSYSKLSPFCFPLLLFLTLNFPDDLKQLNTNIISYDPLPPSSSIAFFISLFSCFLNESYSSSKSSIKSNAPSSNLRSWFWVDSFVFLSFSFILMILMIAHSTSLESMLNVLVCKFLIALHKSK